MPDYEFILWDRKKFDINSTLWTKQAFEAKKYAFVADYIRLYALYNYGGIYLDTDVQVVKKFDDLLGLPYFIGTQFDSLIEAAIIGTQKHSDWALDCLKYYENRAFIKNNGNYDMTTLPRIMKSQIKKTRKITRIETSQINRIRELIIDESSFFLFPSQSFSPKNHQTGKIIYSLDKVYTIHHYNSSWLPIKSHLRIKAIRLLGLNFTEKIISLLKLRKIYSKVKSLRF